MNGSDFVVRSIFLITALLLTGCEQKIADRPSKPAPTRPELKVNLKEELGREVELTGLLVGVSMDGTKEQEKWGGEATVQLECKGMTLTCRFPRAAKMPVNFQPGLPGSDMRLVTLRGTVASVEPEGRATLTGCVLVSDPAKP
jgi:hypothetical protein